MIFETLVVGPLEVNCYILGSEKSAKAIIIDPGDEEKRIKEKLDELGLVAAFVINTHGHFDHIGGDDAFGVPIYIHTDDAHMLKDARSNFSVLFNAPKKIRSEIRKLKDKDSISLDEIELEVLHTPGHTTGGLCLLLKKPKAKMLFSGDSLFYQSIGRTDLGGSAEVLRDSINKKLLSLPDDTVVYPGHGPSTTIGQERKHNVFLQ